MLENRLPKEVRYPNIASPSVGLQITSLMVFLAAAAIGYLADYFVVLTIKSDGIEMGLNILVSTLPLIGLVVYIQDFAVKIRQGKILFFRNLTTGQAVANSLFIFTIAVFLALITQRVINLGGHVQPSWQSFIILMLASYLCNWLIWYFRKHPLEKD